MQAQRRADQRLEARVRISKLNGIDANYRLNHDRKPDLSADIRIGFPEAEYVGKYLNHGGSKTVFIIRRSGHTRGEYDGNLLKIRLQTADYPWDDEPEITKASEREGYNILPKLYWEGIGVDGDDEYHCWVVERCIPLNQLAKLGTCDKEQCVLAACRVITRAALCRLHLSDCHYYNLGLRITPEVWEHEVVIIDAGSRGLTEHVGDKTVLKETMKKLWKWSRKEIGASSESTKKLWYDQAIGIKLEDIERHLDGVWYSRPYLTTDSEVPTTILDEENIAKRESALHEFTKSPRGKILQLIGRSCVEWRGCEWNKRLDELCMDVVRQNEIAFTDGEDKVLEELHERITIEKTKKTARKRSEQEINSIIHFWWHLQKYRAAFMQRKHLNKVTLTETQIEKVKRDLEDREFWFELTPRQQQGKTSSIYNAMLHARCGWSTVANAIIKHRLPRLSEDMSEYDDIIQHSESVERFCRDLIKWLKQFAEEALIKWNSERYQIARASAEK